GERDGGALPYPLVRVAAGNMLERRLGVPYPLFSPRLLPVLRRAVAGADVVHVHGFLYQGSIAALALGRHARHRPLRVLAEHVGFAPFGHRALDAVQHAAVATIGRATARRAEAIAAYNDRVAAELHELAP